MLITPLIQTGHSTAVCFFSGWGMDARPFGSLCTERLGCDLLLMHSYHLAPEDEGRSFDRLSARYRQVAVVGWSFGVAIAWGLIHRYSRAVVTFIAVNGTPCPIHSQYGIDPRIMRRTIERFGEVGREAFYANMCGNEREKFTSPARSTENLLTELLYLQNRFEGTEEVRTDKASLTFPMRAYVSQADRIIPAKSQISAWDKWEIPYHCLEGSHYNGSLLMDVLQQAASHVRTLSL